jgi:hypothetical protein
MAVVFQENRKVSLSDVCTHNYVSINSMGAHPPWHLSTVLVSRVGHLLSVG